MSVNKAKKSLYPSFGSYLFYTAVHLCRGPMLAAVLTTLLHEPFQQLYAWTGLNDGYFFIAAACAVHSTLYVGMSGFFAFCDTFGLLQQHKLPRTKRMIPSAKQVRGTIMDALVNQILVYPVAMYFAYFHLVGGLPDAYAPLASSFVELWKIFIFAETVNEVGFYCVHRLVHESSFLYKYVHKKHHNYVGTITIAAEHAHPIESVFANVLPTVGYCLYARVHALVFLVWLGWRTWETLEAHSGFCFKNTFLSKIGMLHAHRAEFHDYHHTVNIGNYGTLPDTGLDYLLRSMTHYLESFEKEDETETPVRTPRGRGARTPRARSRSRSTKKYK